MTPRVALMFAMMLPLLTTCQLLKPKKETAKPAPEPTSMREKALAGEGCSCQTVITLIDGLEACERRASKCEPDEEEEKNAKPKVKTRTVTVQGPPKKCSGGKRPNIVPVPQSECKKGMVCLGDKGQRALAINLAAYEKFVNQIMECESGR